MEYFNEQTHYSVKELEIITGLESTLFYKYKNKFEMKKYRLPSGRIGYGVHFKNFEKVINEGKNYPFDISEFEMYQEQKRPIIRQFLNVTETVQFMNLVGENISHFSVKRRLREGILPGYVIERKYLVPIIALVKRYSLSITNQVNHIVSEVIQDKYKFML